MFFFGIEDAEIWLKSAANSLVLKVWLSVIFMGNNNLQVISFSFLHYYLCINWAVIEAESEI